MREDYNLTCGDKSGNSVGHLLKSPMVEAVDRIVKYDRCVGSTHPRLGKEVGKRQYLLFAFREDLGESVVVTKRLAALSLSFPSNELETYRWSPEGLTLLFETSLEVAVDKILAR